jgi:lipoate-protein ligase A
MKLSCIISKQNNPYKNLALEEYLLWHVEKGECILYLWQNRRTVVIGINQNPWKECHVKELEQDEGFLVRRMSGGGAVFHDLGNLNFTFLVRKEDYDVSKQLDVIIEAVARSGVKAVKSGRNDILADGKKFSGNAFLSSRGHNYHHGTILVDVDMSQLSKYLNVSHQKLQSKGVSSVRSRVVNLKELSPGITIRELEKCLIEAFGEVYRGNAREIKDTTIDYEEIEGYEKRFSSWDWKFGRRIPFTTEYGNRFSWGDLTLQFHVEGGYIVDAIAYSDGMETDFIHAIGDRLKGVLFSSVAITEELSELSKTITVDDTIFNDITNLINEHNF